MTSANRLTSCFAVFLVAVAMMIFSPIRVAEAAVLECWPDQDMDGYGDGALAPFQPQDGVCDTGQQESDNNLDCDDTDDTAYPGAPEIPGDGVDQDCNGLDAALCYLDADADGFGGNQATEVIAEDGFCDASENESDNAWDCNDGDPTINPDAEEIWADGIDSDCNTDEICYTDYDADGWGISEPKQSLDMDCNDFGESDGQQLEDCDDADANNFPGNPEVCDAQDNDCDILIDEDTIDTDADDLCDLIDPDADGDSVANVDEQPGDTDQDDSEDWLDADDDGDSVLTIDEDPNGNGDPLDDDTDGDNMPNYLDMDDDDDGVPTIDEDRNGDGNPANDDFDGDGVPDYLDPDQAPDLIFEDGFEGDDTVACTIDFCRLQFPVIINDTGAPAWMSTEGCTSPA